jgi:hypothetical protein
MVESDRLENPSPVGTKQIHNAGDVYLRGANIIKCVPVPSSLGIGYRILGIGYFLVSYPISNARYPIPNKKPDHLAIAGFLCTRRDYET